MLSRMMRILALGPADGLHPDALVDQLASRFDIRATPEQVLGYLRGLPFNISKERHNLDVSRFLAFGREPHR